MNKKALLSGALATSVAIAATFGGCSLVSSNTSEDMKQVIAEVTVAQAATFDEELDAYKSAVGTSSVIKRELVAYFLNVGYSYIQNGYTYEQVFKMLVDALVENSVLAQYATMYLLKDKATNTQSALGYDKDALEKFKSFEKESEKYEYLLGSKGVGTENVEHSDDVKLALYSLRSSLNSAIDSYEKNIIKEDSSDAGTETRTTPSGVDAEQDDYFPVDANGNLDYNVYTGYEGYLLADSGIYKNKPIEGTTRATRIRAYNSFISSLASSTYNLVDKTNENLRDIYSLAYIEDEYVSQLEQRIINKCYDIYEEEQEKFLKGDNGEYTYIKAIYNDLLNLQTEKYASESSFNSALSGMSKNSFLLYAPETEDGGVYGFVYNILLPFSASQSAKLSEFQTLYADTDKDGGYKTEYYKARNTLLGQIETTDQRAAWFNGETKYAFKADADSNYFGKAEGKDGWLFFENNLKYNDRYKPLEKYCGKYSYNGEVYESENDFVLLPNKLDIDDMLDEFVAYVDYATGSSVTVSYDKTAAGNYGDLTNLFNDEDKVDYSNFVYTSGKVNFGNNATYNEEAEAANRANILNENSEQYKALAAVNELQYAYTTDTGVLNQYVGYSVNAGDTEYIKEFEHAAHEAIKGGAGTFNVCAGDYGWHLIYVTYTFSPNGGSQYSPVWTEDNVKTEGTFENLFYEWVKSNDISDISTTRRTQIITEFKNDDTVVTYENRYKDLLKLSNN